MGLTMSTLVRLSVLAFSTFGLAACAFGSTSLTVPFTKDDGGANLDAASKDAGKDVATAKDSAVEQQDSQPPPPPPPQCTLQQPVSGIPQCDNCMEASCCKESNACLGSSDCMDFVSCLDGCFPSDGGAPDQTCINSCMSQYPTGFQLYDTFSTCGDSKCSSDCR